MSSPIAGAMVINATLFGVESNVRKKLNFENPLMNSAVAGAAGGFATAFILNPTEAVKIQMQKENCTYRSTLACTRDLIARHGLRSLSHGFSLTAFRETPACAVYIASYEMMTGENSGNKASLLQLLIAGGIAGCLSWIFTYPIDTVKTKYQADSNLEKIDCDSCINL